MEQSVAVKSKYNLKSTVNKAGALNSLVRCFLLLCLAKMFICYTFFDVSESLSLALTAIMAVIIFFSVLLIFNRLQFSIQITWILLLLFIFISYLIHPSGLEYICNTVIFLGMLTILPYIDLKFRTVKLLGIIFAFYCVLVIIFAPKFDSDNTSLVNLNTNTSGFVLFLLEFYVVATASVVKKNYKKIFYAVVLCAIIFQVLFAGRSSLIGTLLIIFYLIFKRYLNKFRKKSVRYLTGFLCVFAIIFAYLYAVTFFNIIGHGNVYIFGKDIFTGRQIIWADAFEQIKGHWLWGIGNTLHSISINGDTSGVTNLHNQLMGYLTCFGLFVTVIYLLMLSILVAKIFSKNNSNFCVAFLITLIIMSYFDTILYSSVNMVFIPIVLIATYCCDHKTTSRVK